MNLSWNRIFHELNLTPLIEMIKGKQDKLTAGENIDITDNVISAVGGGGGGTTNYNLLNNKPSINGIELEGNKSTAQLGISYDDLTNKPNLFSGNYNDLTNRPDLFSGDYNDLTNKPTIPVVNNGTLTIKENGVTKGTFTANQFGDTEVNLTGGGSEEIVELTQAQYDALEQAGQLNPDVAYFINDATGGTLGTAAYKDYTDRVRPNNFGLVESHAVYSAINSALSSIYTPRGNIDCADLTASMLVDANIGNVYETNDSGTTSALFIQGAGHTINTGDNVGIIRAGANVILFNLMGNAFDLTNYQTKDDNNLTTTSKTVVGAINELDSEVGTLQNTTDTLYNKRLQTLTFTGTTDAWGSLSIGTNVLNPTTYWLIGAISVGKQVAVWQSSNSKYAIKVRENNADSTFCANTTITVTLLYCAK